MGDILHWFLRAVAIWAVLAVGIVAPVWLSGEGSVAEMAIICWFAALVGSLLMGMSDRPTDREFDMLEYIRVHGHWPPHRPDGRNLPAPPPKRGG